MAETQALTSPKEASVRELEEAGGSRIDLMMERTQALKESVAERGKILDNMLEAIQILITNRGSPSNTEDRQRPVPILPRTGTTNNFSRVSRLTKLDCPRFSGDKVKQWLFKVEQFFEIDRTPDELKIGLASVHFDDLAATWHQSIVVEAALWKHVRHDWLTYKLLLQGRFNEMVDDPIAELKQLQETDGIVDYHEKFELIKSRLNLPEAYLVSIFLAGLRTDMQINVKMFQPQSIEQCLMMGRLYEKAQNHWKRLTIKTDGDDYPKEAQPLNVQSDAARPSLSNFQVHNSSHEDKESSDGKTAIQQKISVEVESLLQQQEVICGTKSIEILGCLECVSQPQNVNATFEDFDKAAATMNHLLPPIGFVVDDSQSGCRSDIESKDIQPFKIVIEEGNNSYVYQESNGMRLRSHILTQQTKPSKSPKSWKFKFKISKDNKVRYIKFWWEEASSKKKLKCGKFWKFHYKNKFICNRKLFTYKKRQKKWPFMGKAAVDKESVEMLRGCTSGQTIGAYGLGIKRWDIHIRVWDPGGSIFRNFSFKAAVVVLVKWSNMDEDEATWEFRYDRLQQYPSIEEHFRA